MAKKAAPASKAAAPSRKAPAANTAAARTAGAKTAGAKTAAAKGPAPKAAKRASAPRAKQAASATPGAATPATVTLRQLAAQLAEDHELAKRQADAVLSGLVGLLVDHLKNGDRIRIGGLGILQVRSRAARQGRNPATGEPITIKASRKIAFRPAKELKEAI